MKRNLLLTCLAIFCFSVGYSQITYKDYGDGLVIPLNSNYGMDIDENGTTDFYINQYPDELGFSPILNIGCLSSPYLGAVNNFGSPELRIFEEGETIQITLVNIGDYIDDDRGSIMSSSGQLADSWTHLEDQYVGFAVFEVSPGHEVANGWMKVAVDVHEKTLILKEMAFYCSAWMEESAIEAGDTGIVSVNELDEALKDIVISPNPVKDQLQLNFDYDGNEKLQISILDNTGKLVEKQIANGSENHTFDASSWAPGIYFVNFSSDKGVRSEKIFVSK